MLLEFHQSFSIENGLLLVACLCGDLSVSFCQLHDLTARVVEKVVQHFCRLFLDEPFALSFGGAFSFDTKTGTPLNSVLMDHHLHVPV